MQSAGKLEDIEKEFCGIGTPATRAGVLEKLVTIGMIERVGDKKTKYLVPTEKGTAIITILPETLQSPLMTAEWEQKLKAVEDGEIDDLEFMEEIITLISDIVSNYEIVKGSENLFKTGLKIIGKCPRCKDDVTEREKSYTCVNKHCGFTLWKNNKFFTSKKKNLTEKIAKELITTGKTKLTGLHSEKTGKTYNATVILDDDGGKYANFKLEF